MVLISVLILEPRGTSPVPVVPFSVGPGNAPSRSRQAEDWPSTLGLRTVSTETLRRSSELFKFSVSHNMQFLSLDYFTERNFHKMYFDHAFSSPTQLRVPSLFLLK